MPASTVTGAGGAVEPVAGLVNCSCSGASARPKGSPGNVRVTSDRRSFSACWS